MANLIICLLKNDKKVTRSDNFFLFFYFLKSIIQELQKYCQKKHWFKLILSGYKNEKTQLSIRLLIVFLMIIDVLKIG